MSGIVKTRNRKGKKPGLPAWDDLNNAIARPDNVSGCIVHSDRGSQFRSRKFINALKVHGLVGSMGRVGAAGDNARYSPCCKKTS
jgi:transposase InsO family protein